MLKDYIYKYFVPAFVKNFRRNKRAKVYNIVKHPNDVFRVLCKVSDAGWNKMTYPSLYGHTDEHTLQVYIPNKYAYEADNAIVNCETDFFRTEKGVYWDKYNEEEFITWATPFDGLLINYDRDTMTIMHAQSMEYIPGTVLSLVGTDCFHWGHFLSQYACKLYYAGENGLLDEEITILYHLRGDATVEQFITDYVKKFPNVTLKKAERRIDYKCEKLIFIPATIPNYHDCNYYLPYHDVVSKSLLNHIDKYVIHKYTENVKNNKLKYDKIFLPREGLRRTLTNYKEIHEFFLSLGFVDIEGSDLTLEQKADIFYHAKEIVGVFGGANQNLMFCNGARCMLFTNYHMSHQSWSYSFARDKVGCWINVAGQDESSDYHSNFTIPLEKVKKAYYEYIHIEDKK